MDELVTAPLTEAAEMIASRSVSSLDLTQAVLKRIETLDPSLGTYVTITAEMALAQARRADEEIAAGAYRGPLHGVPLGVKDLFNTRGVRTACGSTILADFIPEQNATVVDRLFEAGSVLLGKQAMTEFALSGYNPAFEPPRNPWNQDRWTGVSSSGSAAAVAASLGFGTLGTDTGGSIRFPSAANGVVGIKPSFGLVSRHGVFPLADSLDTVGPMARTVEDAAILLGAIAGPDEKDPFSIASRPADYRSAVGRGVKGVRIGVDHEYCKEGVDPEVESAFLRSLDVLKELGAETVSVDIKSVTEVCQYWLLVTGADALMHHGASLFPDRASEYGPVFRGLLEAMNVARAVDYARAEAARARCKAMLEAAFRDIDILACPSMAMPALPVSELPAQPDFPPETIAAMLAFQAPYNFSGNPTISLPCGFSEDGLPLSLQLVGPIWGESDIIAAAYAYENAAGWRDARPELPRN